VNADHYQINLLANFFDLLSNTFNIQGGNPRTIRLAIEIVVKNICPCQHRYVDTIPQFHYHRLFSGIAVKSASRVFDAVGIKVFKRFNHSFRALVKGVIIGREHKADTCFFQGGSQI